MLQVEQAHQKCTKGPVISLIPSEIPEPSAEEAHAQVHISAAQLRVTLPQVLHGRNSISTYEGGFGFWSASLQDEVQKLFQGPNLFTYSTNDRQDCLNTSVIVSYSTENHAVTFLWPCAEWRSNGPKDSGRSGSS